MKGLAAAPEQAVEPMKQTPMYQAYAQLMPDAGTNWPKTIAQTARLVGREFDWSEQVKKLTSPTLLLVGDWDSVRIGHATAFFELLGGGRQDGGWDGFGKNTNRLAVLPGATHYTIFSDPRLATTAALFLDT